MRLILSVLLILCSAELVAADEWLSFRGPGGANATTSVQPPVDWDLESGIGIAWSADLPGKGVSSPIVVQGRVIITADSGPESDRLHVLAFDAMTGKKLWHRRFWATGRTLCHQASAVAAPTPASDGELIFAFYSSNDLICLDAEGNLKWLRSLTDQHPLLGNDIGMAASPAVVGDAVVVQCECQTAGFVTAFDKATGSELWSEDRPKQSNWSSPLSVSGGLATDENDDQPAVLVQSGAELTGYNAAGEEQWKQQGEFATIASPTILGNFMLTAAGGLTLFDRTTGSPEILWQKPSLRPGSPSPVTDGQRAYIVGRGGFLTCVSMADGEKIWKRRLGGSFWATPLLAGGRLYCINQEGDAFVVSADEDGKVLAKPKFGQDIYASPAAAEGGIYVRSQAKLWKIAAAAQASLPAELVEGTSTRGVNVR